MIVTTAARLWTSRGPPVHRSQTACSRASAPATRAHVGTGGCARSPPGTRQAFLPTATGHEEAPRSDTVAPQSPAQQGSTGTQTQHGGRREPTAAARAIAGLSSLPDLWAWAAEQYGDALAVEDRHHKPHTSLTFKHLHSTIQQFGAGLHTTGVRPRDRVALFAESSGRWLVADAGIMASGAANAVRGVDAISTDELTFILQSCQASTLVVQDGPTLERLLPQLPDWCTLAVVLWGPVPTAAVEREHHQLVAVTYDELLDKGRGALVGWTPHRAARADMATLAFTSGTSGKPKGVVTTHDNLLSQLTALDFMPVAPGDVAVSYLPPWHAYGRTLDYYLLSRGAKLHYSRLKDLKQDLVAQQPQIFVSVPLLLDNLQRKAVQELHKQAGALQMLDAATHHVRARRVGQGTSLDHARRGPSPADQTAAAAAAAMLAPIHENAERSVFRCLREQLGFSRSRWVVSGGGSLTPQIDDFYEAIGVPVVVGYGLTETSPVLTLRHMDCNVRGTIGPPIPGTSIRIASATNRAEELPDGEQGVIMASGPQVMCGYWRNEEATSKAFPLGRDPHNGWLDTGDLGWRVPYLPGSRMGGHVVISGREKDTLVLLSGENVEPQPLEDLLCTSPHIAFAVLVGSGRRALGALLVPSAEALDLVGGDVDSPQMRDLMQGEVACILAHRGAHERVRAFQVLAEPFTVEDGTLTRTMKPRKATIFAKYAEQVAALEKQLR